MNKELNEIKRIAIGMGFESKTRNKQGLIDELKIFFKKLKKNDNVSLSYTKIQPLGNRGKDGITYLVKNSKGDTYAMKTFSKKKSSRNIEKEGNFQTIAARAGLSPKVMEINPESKYIVMEKMDHHLYDTMKNQNGNLTKKQQTDIVNIFKKLDEIGVFHADSNIMNYMYKNGKLYIIDFGMSKSIDSTLINKLKTNKPNMKFMLLGFILKLKEMNCPASSYEYLSKEL